MQLTDAISLIRFGNFQPKGKEIWADLGCGTGLFTRALASFLPSGSLIYAIDSNQTALKKISGDSSVVVETRQLDFITDNLKISGIDGILMANSFHYVKNKRELLKKLGTYLNINHTYLIVEYDTDKPVAEWVPYPISYILLKSLFAEFGYSSITKLSERPSIYGRSNIYAAIVKS